jgi:nucleoside diphosphate kinase
MRKITAVLMFVFISLSANANDYKKLIIGKWEAKGITLYFLDDGTLVEEYKIKGNYKVHKNKYRISGNELVFVFKNERKVYKILLLNIISLHILEQQKEGNFIIKFVRTH